MSQSIENLEEFATFGLNELLRWIAADGINFGFERSVRCQFRSFETRRALFTFAKHDSGAHSLERTLQQIRAMNAPDALQTNLARFFPAAAYIHFGFECSGHARIGKCYLELPVPPTEGPPAAGRLQFLGFKWSMNSSNVFVVTRYRIHSACTWHDAAHQLLSGTASDFQSALAELLSGLGRDDLARTERFHVLEIEEEGSDRRSCDLNIYNLERNVDRLSPHLPGIVSALELPMSQVEEWVARYASAPLGHVAAGRGRDDAPFLTLYHGERVHAQP